MISLSKFFFIVLLASITTCASSQSDLLLPDLDPLDRVWIDDAQNFYSIVQGANGEVSVHQRTTGAFYTYQMQDGQLSISPAHAPFLRQSGANLLLGDKVLEPASIDTQEISFRNRGIQFYGILTVPESDSPVPLIVNAHGSERDAATTFDWAAAWYTEAGFATLIFDKRGTGKSGGRYTHDFDILASDLEAAVAAVSEQDGIDSKLIGVGGYSQGVYVTTLAASRNSTIQFIIASYGMVQSPLAEDYLETQLHFVANYPDEDWDRFKLLVEACEKAFALRENSQWKLVRQYRREWRNRINPDKFSGTLTGDGCLQWPGFVLRLIGRSQFPPGLDWDHDPLPIVESLDIPVIWQFGEADEDAPSATSITQVELWIAEGKPFKLHTYPQASHGIFQTGVDSNGDTYRYKDPIYIKDLIDWLQLRIIDERLAKP